MFAPINHSRSIVMKSSSMMHLIRGYKQERERAIGLDDLRDLPAHLARPMAILKDRRNGNLLFVFQPLTPDPAGRLAKVVVVLAHVIT